MILPQAPINPPTDFNIINEVQAADQFQHRDVHQILKEALLRHLVKHSIKQNDEQAIITGVTIRDIKDNRKIMGHEEETEHFAASLNKVPVALLVLEDLRTGKLSLDQTMAWVESDRRAGPGVYDQADSPLQASLRDVIYDMLNRSGNTAVRILVNGALGGAAAVNERWAAKPDLTHTYLIPVDASRFFLGNSTSSESLWALEQLVKKQDKYAKFMRDALATNIFPNFGVRSQLAGNDYIVLVNKIGAVDDIEGNNRHDVGVIYNTRTKRTYSYSLFTTSPFESDTATLRAHESLQDKGRYLLRFAGDHKQHTQDKPKTFMHQTTPDVDDGRILY